MEVKIFGHREFPVQWEIISVWLVIDTFPTKILECDWSKSRDMACDIIAC